MVCCCLRLYGWLAAADLWSTKWKLLTNKSSRYMRAKDTDSDLQALLELGKLLIKLLGWLFSLCEVATNETMIHIAP